MYPCGGADNISGLPCFDRAKVDLRLLSDHMYPYGKNCYDKEVPMDYKYQTECFHRPIPDSGFPFFDSTHHKYYVSD